MLYAIIDTFCWGVQRTTDLSMASGMPAGGVISQDMYSVGEGHAVLHERGFACRACLHGATTSLTYPGGLHCPYLPYGVL